MAFMPSWGARPACEARPRTLNSAVPTPLRAVFRKSMRTEGRFKDKDRVAAARFRFEELREDSAADLFIGSP